MRISAEETAARRAFCMCRVSIEAGGYDMCHGATRGTTGGVAIGVTTRQISGAHEIFYRQLFFELLSIRRMQK